MFLSTKLTSIMLRNLRKPWEYDQCPQLSDSKTNRKQKGWWVQSRLKNLLKSLYSTLG